MIDSLQGLKLLFFGVILCGLFVVVTRPFYQYQGVFLADQNEELAQAISPVVQGGNLFFFPYRSVRQSLLRWSFSMADVKFRPIYSGFWELKIIPQQRIPMVLLKSKERLMGLDREGLIFPVDRKLSLNGINGIKVIEILPPENLVPGDHVPLEVRSRIEQVLASLDKVGEVKFSRLVLHANEEWTLFTDEGIRISMGSSEGLSSRLTLLSPILRLIEKNKIKADSIDLRSEKMPVLMRSAK